MAQDQIGDERLRDLFGEAVIAGVERERVVALRHALAGFRQELHRLQPAQIEHVLGLGDAARRLADGLGLALVMEPGIGLETDQQHVDPVVLGPAHARPHGRFVVFRGDELERVIGADLPDQQVGPLQRDGGAHPLGGGRRGLARNRPVGDDHVHARRAAFSSRDSSAAG